MNGGHRLELGSGTVTRPPWVRARRRPGIDYDAGPASLSGAVGHRPHRSGCALKRRYDPDNVFRDNFNIDPVPIPPTTTQTDNPVGTDHD